MHFGFRFHIHNELDKDRINLIACCGQHVTDQARLKEAAQGVHSVVISSCL